MIAAGLVFVLVAPGYLRAAAHDRAANRRPGSAEQAYEQWINGFATGLGDRPAAVILEPDALAQLNSCLDNGQQQARLHMLSYAVKTLRTKNHRVYLDAGHSNWVPAEQMAARLRAADVAQAYGFSLNVSNYDPTDQEIGYATELDRDLGMRKRFVIDTSRNGTGSAGDPLDPGAGPISKLCRAPAGAQWRVGSSLTLARWRPTGFGPTPRPSGARDRPAHRGSADSTVVRRMERQHHRCRLGLHHRRVQSAQAAGPGHVRHPRSQLRRPQHRRRGTVVQRSRPAAWFSPASAR